MQSCKITAGMGVPPVRKVTTYEVSEEGLLWNTPLNTIPNQLVNVKYWSIGIRCRFLIKTYYRP